MKNRKKLLGYWGKFNSLDRRRNLLWKRTYDDKNLREVSNLFSLGGIRKLRAFPLSNFYFPVKKWVKLYVEI